MSVRKTLAFLFICLLGAVRTAHAQPEQEPDVQWAYASFFGTGWYKINDQRSAFIVRTAPRWYFGEAGIGDDGKREIGYVLRLPLTLGLNQFDFGDIPGIVDPDNYATASINVGFDVDIPVTERLSLRPNIEAGYGTILGESDYAWVYRGELRSRYRFSPGDIGWTLHGALGYAGHTPKSGSSDDFTYLSIAAELGHATRWRRKGGEQVNLHWQLGYTDFLDGLDFESAESNLTSVGNYWQIAASLAMEERPFRIWRLNFDRLGIGFNFSPSGEHEAIKLIFRSAYEL